MLNQEDDKIFNDIRDMSKYSKDIIEYTNKDFKG